jgi:hypothetical protein
MATRIVHFGEDYNDRIQLLTGSGYAVEACGTSLAKLNESLCQAVDAVVIEEDGSPSEIDIVSIVRSHNWVPLILFEGVARKFDSLQFDTAIPVNTPARYWLFMVSQTVEQKRALLAEYSSLTALSAAFRDQILDVRRKLRSERSCARRLRSRSTGPPFDPH